VESAHRGEIGGQTFRVPGLKLLDQKLNIGGDDFFRGLRFGFRWKRGGWLNGCRGLVYGLGGGFGGFLHLWLLVFFWRFHRFTGNTTRKYYRILKVNYRIPI